MATYFVRVPKETVQKAKMDSLVCGLENFYGFETFEVIGIETALESLDPILRKLSMTVLEDGQRWDEIGRGNGKPKVDAARKVDRKPKKVASKIEQKECVVCGDLFTPYRSKQKYCSTYCREKYWSQKKKEGYQMRKAGEMS